MGNREALMLPCCFLQKQESAVIAAKAYHI